MLVFFWTDVLIFLLVVMVLLFVFYARGREHLRTPWREVARSGVAMGSLVVLGFYVTIGLLDSVHFRLELNHDQDDGQVQYANEILSVFDWLVTPLRVREEKTYSAPFAAYLYTKETVELPDGRQQRQYPRLKHGGRHLSDPETEKTADIVVTVLFAAAKGLAVWGAVCVVLIAGRGRWKHETFRSALGRMRAGQTTVRWRSVLYTLGVLMVLSFVAADLSMKYHILGTDKIGENVFYQALKSIRTGLVIGTLTTLVMLPFAVLLGIMAGYFRGWVDDVIQYLYTTLSSIPGVLLIAAAVLILQVYLDNHAAEFSSVAERADLRLLFLCLILGVTSWTSLCRYLRGETLKLREVDYIQAATALGVRHFSILTRHILPNVMHIVLITVVLDFSALVLAEAVLSYVQIGVDPTMNSWGNMINSARLEMAREPIVWWSLLSAFIFMFSLVLAANLFSDALRDAFDPRLRQQR
jgi:peptide/nickel transport system permease protein